MDEDKKGDVWLTRAKDAFDKSTTYNDNNYRKKWENNIRRFQSRHEMGSKYNKASYKFRSKLFRPKTRSAERQNEAAAVAAFFASQEVICVEPYNAVDPTQQAAAAFKQALVEYRLSDDKLPWFITCIGAFQDAQVVGVVCSYQSWQHKTKTVKYEVEVENVQTGEITTGTEEETVTLFDNPFVELFPIENARIDPNAKWWNPIKTSPYVILQWPMYVKDVKAKMEKENEKTGEPKWESLEDGLIKSCRDQRFDSTRQTREKEREDKTDTKYEHELSDFDIVWVHENIMEVDGEDRVFWTLGTEHRLSDPVPLEDVYWHGERPVTMGVSVIETHKIYPDSITELGDQVQKEINENVNQRNDNVKFVMNKRWFVKRGTQVDLRSITRNVAGGVTMVNSNQRNDPDVVAHDFEDVTSSAYEEQDRLNADFDELVGNFSVSTVNTNRKIGETLGGTAMARASTNLLVEYVIRTFAETWLEPTMRQILMLEEKYESDEQVLTIAAQKAQLEQKFQITGVEQYMELLQVPVKVTVNVGLGATDPMLRLQNFSMGIGIVINALNEAPPGILNVMEVIKEVFGFIGFKDGARFLMEQFNQDPEKMQMSQVIQELQGTLQQMQAQLESKQQEQEVKLLLGQMKTGEVEIKERGQDRRKAAELQTDLTKEKIKLFNPVAGEKPSAGQQMGV